MRRKATKRSRCAFRLGTSSTHADRSGWTSGRSPSGLYGHSAMNMSLTVLLRDSCHLSFKSSMLLDLDAKHPRERSGRPQASRLAPTANRMPG